MPGLSPFRLVPAFGVSCVLCVPGKTSEAVDVQLAGLADGVVPGKVAEVFANTIPVAKNAMTVMDAILALTFNIFSSLTADPNAQCISDSINGHVKSMRPASVNVKFILFIDAICA